MLLFGLLIVAIWMLLVRFFRRSLTLQTFVAEIMGDETPELALRNFYAAKSRLEHHLAGTHVDHLLRQRIETALEQSSESDSIMSDVDR